MFPQLYSVLALFESPRGHLAEISRTLRHSPHKWVTEWVWIEQRHVMTLQPLDAQAAGAFEEGELRLADSEGELCWANGHTDALVRVKGGALPAATRNILELHLS